MAYLPGADIPVNAEAGERPLTLELYRSVTKISIGKVPVPTLALRLLAILSADEAVDVDLVHPLHLPPLRIGVGTRRSDTTAVVTRIRAGTRSSDTRTGAPDKAVATVGRLAVCAAVVDASGWK